MFGYFLNGAYNHFITFPALGGKAGKKTKTKKRRNNKGGDDDDDDATCKLLLLERKSGRDQYGQSSAVPKGFFAVYVGDEMERFVVPTSYLCTPPFRALMERAAEEFGFEQTGGLRIPCDEDDFRKILATLEATRSK